MPSSLALLAAWAARDDLRALVLTGRGRSFCAGAALGDVGGADWTDNPLTRLCDALEAFPLPTVAGLNGGVYGGGVELALACDFRVGVTGMRAFVPPARLGIHYEPAGIARAIDRLGSQAARRLFLLAETFDAEALHAARLPRPPRRPRCARRPSSASSPHARRPRARSRSGDEAHHRRARPRPPRRRRPRAPASPPASPRPTTPRASPPSARSARRASPAADRAARPCCAASSTPPSPRRCPRAGSARTCRRGPPAAPW